VCYGCCRRHNDGAHEEFFGQSQRETCSEEPVAPVAAASDVISAQSCRGRFVRFRPTAMELSEVVTRLLTTVVTAPCRFQGCKNRPDPFPGRMSYKATKPGLAVCHILACFFIVLLFIRAPFMYC